MHTAGEGGYERGGREGGKFILPPPPLQIKEQFAATSAKAKRERFPGKPGFLLATEGGFGS